MPTANRQPNPSIEDIRRILTDSRVIAILGAHPNTSKAAHYVPAYLHGQGYRIIPVNVRYAGQTLWGERVRADLAEVDEPIDLLDVFRRADHLPSHLPEILGLDPLPKVVWFQTGVRHDTVADELRQAGIEVVQDRCTLADHQTYL